MFFLVEILLRISPRFNLLAYDCDLRCRDVSVGEKNRIGTLLPGFLLLAQGLDM